MSIVGSPLPEQSQSFSLTYSALRCGLAEVLTRAPRPDSPNLPCCPRVTGPGPLAALRLKGARLTGLDVVTDLDCPEGRPGLCNPR
ncbi:hypothetical protein GCM10007079_28080 [Nocardiopsis terrae]|nr:hypothetical protein GCM10007079_28080 [Nocardiopsis terrae]